MRAPDVIERWLSSYVEAWASDDPATASALFSQDARYFTAPYRPPLVGSDQIATWWIGQGESRLRWTFEHEVLAETNGLYVVRGTTTYPDNVRANGRPEVYHNLWLVTLADDGRAREFIEYWMLGE
jgi:hypothetical protein